MYKMPKESKKPSNYDVSEVCLISHLLDHVILVRTENKEAPDASFSAFYSLFVPTWSILSFGISFLKKAIRQLWGTVLTVI